MTELSCFLKENAIPVENVKYVASKRFTKPVLDKNGKPTGKTVPIEWEIKNVSNEQDELIRKECTKSIPVGKRGQRTMELDTDKYSGRLCAACIVYPNLNSAELQDSYGVKSADSLLKAMLTAGEYIDLKSKVLEVNGFDLSMEDLVDEAKN